MRLAEASLSPSLSQIERWTSWGLPRCLLLRGAPRARLPLFPPPCLHYPHRTCPFPICRPPQPLSSMMGNQRGKNFAQGHTAKQLTSRLEVPAQALPGPSASRPRLGPSTHIFPALTRCQFQSQASALLCGFRVPWAVAVSSPCDLLGAPTWLQWPPACYHHSCLSSAWHGPGVKWVHRNEWEPHVTRRAGQARHRQAFSEACQRILGAPGHSPDLEPGSGQQQQIFTFAKYIPRRSPGPGLGRLHLCGLWSRDPAALGGGFERGNPLSWHLSLERKSEVEPNDTPPTSHTPISSLGQDLNPLPAPAHVDSSLSSLALRVLMRI